MHDLSEFLSNAFIIIAATVAANSQWRAGAVYAAVGVLVEHYLPATISGIAEVFPVLGIGTPLELKVLALVTVIDLVICVAMLLYTSVCAEQARFLTVLAERNALAWTIRKHFTVVGAILFAMFFLALILGNDISVRA